MTPTQQQVLSAVRDLTVGDVSPSFRDIASATGLGVGNVHRIVEILVEEGFLARSDHRCRSLRVVGQFDREAIERLTPVELRYLRNLIDARLAA